MSSCRLPARVVLVVSLLLTSVASAESAVPPATRVEPGPATATHEPAAPGSAARLGGFDLLAVVGYGVPTGRVYDLELDPYGATFGIESGYTFAMGLRLGVHLDYGLGRSINQNYDPLLADAFALTTEASSLNASLSLGYDLWLRFLILRYSLNLGLSWMAWDFGEVPADSVRGYASTQSSVLGFQLTPGLSLLWPVGLFECGIGFDYFLQVTDQIPSGVLTKLLLGVRL